jgi:hypothetical protein
LVETRLRALTGVAQSALPPPVPYIAGDGWRRMQFELAGELRACMENLLGEGGWADHLAAPPVPGPGPPGAVRRPQRSP